MLELRDGLEKGYYSSVHLVKVLYLSAICVCEYYIEMSFARLISRELKRLT